MDNLNTHKPASLYKRYPADEARRIMKRLEIHYTPKHREVYAFRSKDRINNETDVKYLKDKDAEEKVAELLMMMISNNTEQ